MQIVEYCIYLLSDSEFLNDGYCPVSDGLVWRPSCEMGSIGCVFDNKCGGGFDKCCFDGCGYSCLPAAIEPGILFIIPQQSRRDIVLASSVRASVCPFHPFVLLILIWGPF